MSAIDWQEIRELLATIDRSDIAELTLESGDLRLSVRRREGVASPAVGAAPAPSETSVIAAPEIPSAAPAVASPPVPTPVSAPPPGAAPADRWETVSAPMVGTFYSAPAPGEPVFVRKGDRVEDGQTLCIIEAMKLMNELEAEVAGRIVEILVENAQPVEFGQPLMYIDPDG
ncbi:MAG: acetyl-CoA carboxylase biotin carboxyl carrier protein [Cyanobacteria bacterium J06642_2]